MIKCLFSMLALFMFGVFFLLPAGCGSTDPSRFYLISPTHDSEAAEQGDADGPAIQVGPITFPDYLDRQQIVSRAGPNTLRVAEFDRWAEPLENSFVRVLAQNLSNLLLTNRVVIFPHTGAMPLDYRVSVDVMRFEGGPDGNVTLNARWILYKGEGKEMLLMKKSSISKAAGEPGDYEALVSAKSDALGELSEKIAETIKAM